MAPGTHMLVLDAKKLAKLERRTTHTAQHQRQPFAVGLAEDRTLEPA